MASSSASKSLPASTIGRVREIHEIERFLDQVSVGLAGMVLSGEPGIGKTQLWRHGVRRAETSGLLTLVARQREVDATTQLGGLADLLGEVPNGGFARLPALQRTAIDIALLRAAPADPGRGASSTAMDERILAAGLLSLIRSLARDAPVLVAIDDLQWLDPATARLLGFVARRLERDRVGFLLTIRLATAGAAGAGSPADPFGGAIDPDLLIRLQVGPLSVAALHEVIGTRVGVALPRPTLLRIHDVSGGNPFYALQLATAFVAVGGGRLAGEALPVPHDLDVLLGRRLDGLTEQMKAMLLVLAALPRPTLASLARVVDDTAGLDAQIEAAVRAGLVELDGSTIQFTHPLLASVVERRAPTANRRAVHRRIARTTDDQEVRAYHLALAADGPDASIAVELERSAVRASARGEGDRALTLLEHALAATPSEDASSIRQRTIALAEAAFRAGDGLRATTLLEGLRRSLGPGRERAEILFRLGSIAQTEDIDRSVDLLRAAATEAGDDVALRARILSELARFPSWLRLGIDERRADRSRGDRLAERVGDRATLAHSLGVLGGVVVRSGRDIPHELMQRAMALEAAGGQMRVDEDGGPSIVYAEMLADDDDLTVARDHV